MFKPTRKLFISKLGMSEQVPFMSVVDHSFRKVQKTVV
jgi:hypothetical protein